MSTVTLTIGPKSYTIACADGEEARIAALGDMIAEKYAQLGDGRAPLEAQNLLFAALFLADDLAEAKKGKAGKAKAEPPSPADPAELHGLRTTIARLEGELAEMRKAPALQSDLFGADASSGDRLAQQLEAIAARAEATASALEAAAASA
jgi:cell division protein ZapA